MSSIRETAEKIAAPTIGKVAPGVYREIVAAIQVALRDRDERAAKIAEQSHQQPCTCTTCLIHAEIAAAIRKQDD